MTYNEAILKLLECADTLYEIEGQSLLDEASSDFNKIVGDFSFSEVADKLELVAKAMFVDYFDQSDLKEFLKNDK